MANLFQDLFKPQHETRAKVKDGDSLWSIAAKHNASVTALRHFNKLDDVNSLRPGQELLIPTAAKGESGHGVNARLKRQSVRKRGHVTADYGDSLTSIASANGLTVKELKEVNPHLKGDRIDAGQQLYVAYGGMKKGLAESVSNVVDNLQDAIEECYVAANNLQDARTRRGMLSYGGSGKRGEAARSKENIMPGDEAGDAGRIQAAVDENGQPLVAIGTIGGVPVSAEKYQAWLAAREDDDKWFLSTAEDKELEDGTFEKAVPKRAPHHTSARIEASLKEMEKMKQASTSGRSEGSATLGNSSERGRIGGAFSASASAPAGPAGAMAGRRAGGRPLLLGTSASASSTGLVAGAEEKEDPDDIDGQQRKYLKALDGLQKAGDALLTWCGKNNVVEIPEGFTIRATINTDGGSNPLGSLLGGLLRGGPFGGGAGPGALVPAGGGLAGAVAGLVGQLMDLPAVQNAGKLQRAAGMAGHRGLLALPPTGGAGTGVGAGSNGLMGAQGLAGLKDFLVGAAARASGGMPGHGGGFVVNSEALGRWGAKGVPLLTQGGGGGGGRGASVVFGGVGGTALVALPEGSTFSISGGGPGGGAGGLGGLGAMGEALSRVGGFLAGDRPSALPAVSHLRTLPALSGGMLSSAAARGGASAAAAAAFAPGAGNSMALSTAVDAGAGTLLGGRPGHKRSMSSPASMYETLGLEAPGTEGKRPKYLLKASADAGAGAGGAGGAANVRNMDAAARRAAFEASIQRAGERAERRAAAEAAAPPSPATPAAPAGAAFKVPDLLNSPGGAAAATPMPKSRADSLAMVTTPAPPQRMAGLVEMPTPAATPMSLGPPLRVPRSLGNLGEPDPKLLKGSPSKIRALWKKAGKNLGKKTQKYLGSCVGAGPMPPDTPGGPPRLRGGAEADLAPRQLYGGKKGGFFRRLFGGKRS